MGLSHKCFCGGKCYQIKRILVVETICATRRNLSVFEGRNRPATCNECHTKTVIESCNFHCVVYRTGNAFALRAFSQNLSLNGRIYMALVFCITWVTAKNFEKSRLCLHEFERSCNVWIFTVAIDINQKDIFAQHRF